MKVRVTINQAPIVLDEIVEGRSEEELFQKFRDAATAQAPFMIKLAMKTMSDQALRKQVIESYNYKFKANEPIPADAREFIAFGERAGFVKRLGD
jgi:hypothetical protein